MTVTLNLLPDQEAKLQNGAAARGIAPEALLEEMVRDGLSKLETLPLQGPRVAGLHEGAYWVSDDFDDPLPDKFWLGEE